MKRVLLIFVITALGLVASFVDAYWGLLLYTWYSFASPLELTFGALEGSRLSLAVGAVLVFTTLHQKRKLISAHQLSYLMILFFVAALCSLASQMRFDTTTIFRNVELLFKLVLIAALSPLLLQTLPRLRGYIQTIAFSGGLLAFYYGVFGIFVGSKQIIGPGRIGDNNGYAVFLTALLPFIFFGVRYFKPFPVFLRNVTLVSMLLGTLTALILTYSRGGFLAGALVLLLLLCRVKSILARTIAWGTIVPALIFTIWIIFSADPNLVEIPEGGTDSESVAVTVLEDYVTRLRSLRSGVEDEDSAGGRIHFWKVAVEMLRSNLFFGVGFNQYTYQYSNYDFSDGAFGSGRAVHSTPLLIASETGLLGFSFFAGMILSLFYCLYAAKRRMAPIRGTEDYEELSSYIAMVRIAVLGFLLGGLFVNVPYQEIFWAFLSIAIAIDKLSRTSCEAVATSDGKERRGAAPC